MDFRSYVQRGKLGHDFLLRQERQELLLHSRNSRLHTVRGMFFEGFYDYDGRSKSRKHGSLSEGF